MEVARRAARTLTFWSVCRVRLMVTFCLNICRESRDLLTYYTCSTYRTCRQMPPALARQMRFEKPTRVVAIRYTFIGWFGGHTSIPADLALLQL